LYTLWGFKTNRIIYRI